MIVLKVHNNAVYSGFFYVPEIPDYTVEVMCILECTHIDLTRKAPWKPTEIQLGKLPVLLEGVLHRWMNVF